MTVWVLYIWCELVASIIQYEFVWYVSCDESSRVTICAKVPKESHNLNHVTIDVWRPDFLTLTHRYTKHTTTS